MDLTLVSGGLGLRHLRLDKISPDPRPTGMFKKRSFLEDATKHFIFNHLLESSSFMMDASNAITMALAATSDQLSPMKEDTAHSRFGGRPYLQRLKLLENAFPPLKPFLENITKENDHGREIVKTHYQRHQQRVPGRCFGLKFEDNGVSAIK